MDPESREQALRRLRSIEGHIRGIQRMLEDGRSCTDLVGQTLAVRRALDRVSQLLVSSHLHQCIATGIAPEIDPERERAIEELLEVLALSGRL